MKPAFCKTIHDPPMSHGDCVRACIASILELNSDSVPHFFHDGCNGLVADIRIRDFLAIHGLVRFTTVYPGDISLAELLAMMSDLNPSAHYMLTGTTSQGGVHMVVCRGGAIAHNPDHCGWSIVGPVSDDSSTGWIIHVLARL
jgi:hypothetical protein